MYAWIIPNYPIYVVDDKSHYDSLVTFWAYFKYLMIIPFLVSIYLCYKGYTAGTLLLVFSVCAFFWSMNNEYKRFDLLHDDPHEMRPTEIFNSPVWQERIAENIKNKNGNDLRKITGPLEKEMREAIHNYIATNTINEKHHIDIQKHHHQMQVNEWIDYMLPKSTHDTF